MRMRRFLTFMALLCVSMFPVTSWATEDQSIKICTTIYSQGIIDVHNVYTDAEHFARLKAVISSLNLQTYSDLEQASGSLGLTIPALDDLIGLDASARTNAATFRQELATFLSETWSDVQSRMVNVDLKSSINTALLSTYKDCEQNYFASLQSRLGQVVTVMPENPPSAFILSIRAFFPSGTVHPTLHIYSIEPAPPVKCTYHGKPAPADYPSSEVSLRCTKPTNQEVSLAVNTNAGTNTGSNGETITIPAARSPQDVTNDRISALEAKFEALARSSPPVGTIEAYAGDLDHDPTAEPLLEASGWLPCDGRSLSMSDDKYSQLFRAIGKSWGGGTNAFNVPDLRGLFLRGLDEQSGRDVGASNRIANRPGGNTGPLVGTIENDEVGPHDYPVHDHGHGHDIQRGVLADGSGFYGFGGGSGGSDIHDRHAQPIVMNAFTGITIGNNSGQETRPKNAAVNYIIRFR